MPWGGYGDDYGSGGYGLPSGGYGQKRRGGYGVPSDSAPSKPKHLSPLQY